MTEPREPLLLNLSKDQTDKIIEQIKIESLLYLKDLKTKQKVYAGYLSQFMMIYLPLIIAFEAWFLLWGVWKIAIIVINIVIGMFLLFMIDIKEKNKYLKEDIKYMESQKF